ncbi:secreted RxLR effector protein 161-like [Humulus lupulus]|uniref:secreted RxLR effector protein 161-like n=1 Tax=Humulus lupulus TaxID=3486 RepID=UPI002B40FDC1|nr:secreted RxLR effector protein 161-like [Humulus lupulus]
MYALFYTRSDICHAVGVVSRYQSNPKREHWIAVKHIVKYLRQTRDYMLVYSGGVLKSLGYTVSNFQTDVDDKKSTYRMIFVLGGGAVIWRSIKQSTFSDSTMEVEYIAASEAAEDVLYRSWCYSRNG